MFPPLNGSAFFHRNSPGVSDSEIVTDGNDTASVIVGGQR